MFCQVQTQSSSLITNFILIIGFIVIVLGVLLIGTLILTRKKQNQLIIKQKQITEKYNSQLLLAQIEVQEETFRHIAKDLHDNVGQLLSTTKMLIGVTEIKLSEVPDTLSTAHATLSKAIQELRLLSRSLDKEWLEQFDFLENLREEIKRINCDERVRASIDCDILISLGREAQIILFRIVQEAIQNAIRHAQPTRLIVTINHLDTFEVKVINDGIAIPVNFKGMGTKNMRHRAKLFGGTVNWESIDDFTVVTIRLPLKNENEN